MLYFNYMKKMNAIHVMYIEKAILYESYSFVCLLDEISCFPNVKL